MLTARQMSHTHTHTHRQWIQCNDSSTHGWMLLPASHVMSCHVMSCMLIDLWFMSCSMFILQWISPDHLQIIWLKQTGYVGIPCHSAIMPRWDRLCWDTMPHSDNASVWWAQCFPFTVSVAITLTQRIHSSVTWIGLDTSPYGHPEWIYY